MTNVQDYIQRQIKDAERRIHELEAELSLLRRLSRAVPSDDGKISPNLLGSKKSRAKYLTYLRVLRLLEPNGTSALRANTMSSGQLLNFLKQHFDQTSNIKTIRSHLHRLKDEGRLNFDKTKNEWSLP